MLRLGICPRQQSDSLEADAAGVPSTGYLLLVVVVVEAETPEEPAEAFDSQALRALRAAAVKANRVKNLMVFIITLYSPPFSRWSQFEQTFGHELRVGNDNR